MKIKNIKQYRSFYKQNVRKSNSDEHAIGTSYIDDNGNKRFGWFEIYHGDKEGVDGVERGIRNFLESFLDMAKDGQAVYEFLQNAVDAGANHFTMAWGEDPIDGNHYALIANNGQMFNFESVRSILNVGSSTKSADSQSIGKFGIGFKLAHRLVGKENGLDELLDQSPSGPILFSWKHNDIQILAEGTTPEPDTIQFTTLPNGKYEIQNEHPWLFKILITCFPVLPENQVIRDTIRLTDGSLAKQDAFSQSEFDVLSRWVKEYRDIFSSEDYAEGSLFFLKLGSGKESDLADKNLREGVRFSLAILQETSANKQGSSRSLSTVQLNHDSPIKKPELLYHYFNISKEKDLGDYLHVRFGVDNLSDLSETQRKKFKLEDDIEVLFGFQRYDGEPDYFRGAPNFYLYFPLSEEVHNFNFVLHSNAFYKAASRTFLHKGTIGEDGINERLLRKIAQRLEIELWTLFTSSDPEDKERFLHLYAALLTSGASIHIDRQWIQKPFIDEISQVLKKLIPIRKSSQDSDYSITDSAPRLRKTKIDLPREAWGALEPTWFYWGPESNPLLQISAKHKLGGLEVSIFTLMQREGMHQYINQWILEDRSRIRTILQELEDFDKGNLKVQNVKDNLRKLMLFDFEDGTISSDEELSELQKSGYIVLHNGLDKITPELRKIGLIPSQTNFDDHGFYQLYNPYLTQDTQLRDQKILIEIVSQCLVEELNVPEKKRVFDVFRSMIEEGKRTERLSELRLFKNQLGQHVKIKQILRSTLHPWLSPFQLHGEETHPELERYLLKDEQKIYDHIIYPFWSHIGRLLIAYDPKSISGALGIIRKLYLKSPESSQHNQQLADSKWLFFKQGFEKVVSPFFHEGLNDLPFESYSDIQSTLNQQFGIQIPDREYLSYFSSSPFKLRSSFEIPEDPFVLDESSLIHFLTFCSCCELDFFDGRTIYQRENGQYEIVADHRSNYYSSETLIISYIERYHSDTLIPLPDSLDRFASMVSASRDALNMRLIQQLDTDSSSQCLDLINVLKEENPPTRKLLFSRLPNLELDPTWEDQNRNEIVLSFLERLTLINDLEPSEIHSKIYFGEAYGTRPLASFDSALDEVIIKKSGIEYKLSRTKILGLEDSLVAEAIIQFAKEVDQRELLNEKKIRSIFKIEHTSESDELVQAFEANLVEERLLENAHQLAFVLLSELINPTHKQEFQIQNQCGDWCDLEGNWILLTEESHPFYDEAWTLSDQYRDAAQLIHLKEHESGLYFGWEKEDPEERSEDLILPMILFQQSCNTKVLKRGQDLIAILNHLYGCWQQTSVGVRSNFKHAYWEPILGFQPNKSVFGDWVLESEAIPAPVASWLEDHRDSKLRFLYSLGLQGPGSDISRLREFLIRGGNSFSNLASLNFIPEELLANTLDGLSNGFLGKEVAPISIFLTSPKSELVVDILSKLINSDNDLLELRFPTYNHKDRIQFFPDSDSREPFLLSEKAKEIIFTPSHSSLFDKLSQLVEIIYDDPAYRSFLNRDYQTLELTHEYIRQDQEMEHEEPFYTEWTTQNGIRLFMVEELNHQIGVEINAQFHELGLVQMGNYHVLFEGDETLIFHRRGYTFEELTRDLAKEGEEQLSDAIEGLIAIRGKWLGKLYQMLKEQELIFDSGEVTVGIKDILIQQDKEEQRQELVEKIKEVKRYSYPWFINYIEYLLSFEETESSTTQKSISFQKIRPFKLEDGRMSQKHFWLEGGSSVIPVNIETFEDFSISIAFKSGKKETITVEGVSKKGQNLLVHIPQGIKQELKSRFHQIVNIQIHFTPVLDLIKRLYDAFSNPETVSEWDYFEDKIEGLHFIYGPPGTGKTTRICQMLEEKYEQSPIFQALILVPTNKAGDVLAKKLVLGNGNISVIRIGNSTDPELDELDNDIYQASLDEALLDGANVIITTIHRLPYYQIQSENGANFRLFDRDIDWDMVIFDEASMINLPYMTFALAALQEINPSCDFIIAGDPKQIPPVVDTSDKKLEELDMDDENIYKMFNISSFDRAQQEKVKRPEDIIENLGIQYRSVPDIGDLFARFSYEGLIQNGRNLNRSPKKALPPGFIQTLHAPISLIDFPLDIKHSVLAPRKLLYSSYHVYAGIFATELIKHLDAQNQSKESYTIGVISPYKAQALMMNRLIQSSGLSERIQVQCDTVHGFQGDECDIVICVFNPTGYKHTGHPKSLLSKEYIYNVAMSRARDYLWILFPFHHIPNNPSINRIREYIGTKARFVPSTTLEQEIFSNPNFIVENSYLTGHDSVNVFGQVDMKYFIKAGATAIDIQLRA